MDKYRFKATNLIAEVFEEEGFEYHVRGLPEQEQLIPIPACHVFGGPAVETRFIIWSDRNDVAMRIFLIIRCGRFDELRLYRAMNALNRNRYFKAYLNRDDDLVIGYDFHVHSSDDCIGREAFEQYIRVQNVLDCSDYDYKLLEKALYTKEPLDLDRPYWDEELDVYGFDSELPNEETDD